MDSSVDAWLVVKQLDECANVLLSSRKATEKEFVQISQYISSGKIDSQSENIRVQKIDKLVEKLLLLKRRISDLACAERQLIDRAVELSKLSMTDPKIYVRMLVGQNLSFCGYEKTARLLVPVGDGYPLLRSQLLSGSDLGDFSKTVFERIDDSSTSSIFSKFVSVNHVYKLYLQEGDLSSKLLLLNIALAEDKEVFLRAILNKSIDELQRRVLHAFNAVYGELKHRVVAPPIHTLLHAGACALKIPTICPTNESTCIACLLASSVPSVHKTKSVLPNIMDAGVPMFMDNSNTLTRDSVGNRRIYI